jgi:hypothetical protein
MQKGDNSMSELDKTIEELEAEVLAELEEASQPSDSGGKADAPKKVKDEVNDEEDLGGAEPEAKVEKGADEDRKEKELGKKASASAKSVSGDAQQKSAGKSDAPQKLAASHEPEEGEVVSEAKMTKAQALEQIGKMKKSEIEEMLASHASKIEEAGNAKTEEELEKLQAEKDAIEEKIASISVKEDVDALVAGEDLSEEFKDKAATIFEAAVKSKIRSEVVRMEEGYAVALEEATETIKEELSVKVDDYLGYVVEQWMQENELAIERGLKGEIAEDFISGLKQLFEDHYIDVPDEKYDVLEAQSEKIAELEEKLNATIEENVEKKKVVESLTREQIVSEVSEDLAATEVEKFKSLTEDVDFVGEDTFRAKLDTLKESYFPKTGGETSFVIDYENGETAQDIDTTDTIRSYMSAISRSKSA